MIFSWQKTILLWGILCGLCYHLAQPYVTLAHAELVESNPAPGEILTDSPEQIRLEFNEPIAPNSTFVIYDKDFGVIPAEVQTNSNSPNVITGNKIQIKKSGVYTIQWLVISEDGHSIDGSFSFAIDFESNMTHDDLKENNMELVALAEGTSVNLPGWFAWMMVVIAIVTPFLVYSMSRNR